MPEDKETIVAEKIVAEELVVGENSTKGPDVKDGMISAKWRYDGTITLGHLLIMLGIVISGISLYTTTVVKLSSHEARITALERLAEGQSQYNKSALEILQELKQSTAVSEALSKDRETRRPNRNYLMSVPEELKNDKGPR